VGDVGPLTGSEQFQWNDSVRRHAITGRAIETESQLVLHELDGPVKRLVPEMCRSLRTQDDSREVKFLTPGFRPFSARFPGGWSKNVGHLGNFGSLDSI